MLSSNSFLSECQFAELAVSLMDRPTTLQTLTSVVKVPVTSGHMAQEDHHLTIKIPSSVLKLIPLTLVFRLTGVELLVTSVTNKCSLTSQWSTSPISPPTETCSKLVRPHSAILTPQLVPQPLPGRAISQSSADDKNFHENEKSSSTHFSNFESFYMLGLVHQLIILGKIMLI